MSEEPFYIPVDDALVEFVSHLDANPRTILSSKFGDGKSFFLQKLRENEEINKQYEFITLYPVNYQVVENKDIFDLIKVDLLFQLFCHKMVSDRVVLNKKDALLLFIQNKGVSLADKLLPYMAEVALQPEECKEVLLAIKGLKIFIDIKKKYDDFLKDPINKEDIDISKYIDKVNDGYLYECDVVTKIIRSSIEDYKRRTGKKVVLIIEDMDRIDPAHLFRILNVLSAHMDCSYRFSMLPQGMIGNKFELDNIVLIVDCDKIRGLFKHFYGDDCDYDGYISKFITSSPFKFSLKAIKTSYYIREIQRITGAPTELVNLIDQIIFESKTIRETVNAFKIENQIITPPTYEGRNFNVNLDTTILKILSILRRMNLSDDALVQYVLSIERSHLTYFIKYVCPYVFLIKNNGELQNTVVLLDHRDVLVNDITLHPKDGCCSVNKRYSYYESLSSESTKIAKYLLGFIVH